MSELTPASSNYTPLQEELLSLYSLNLEEKDLLKIKELIDEYLEKKGLTQYKAEILQALYDTQEIAQCSNCDSWQELGEMYPEQLCEGCYGDSGDEE